MPREALLGALVMSLLLTSTFIGLVNLAANNQFPADLFGGTTSIDGALQYQPPDLSGGVTFTEINYSISNGIDSNTSRIIKGHWAQDDLGYHTLYDEDSLVALNYIQPIDSTYVVKYTVNNSLGVSYFLTPRFIVLTSILGNINGESSSDIRVIFDSNGVHVKKYPLGLFGQDEGDYFFYPSYNIQNTLAGGSIITITLDNFVQGESNPQAISTNSILTVSKDGTHLFSTNVKDVIQGVFAYYGGYGSYYAGFNMYKVDANFVVNLQTDSTHYLTFIDAFYGETIKALETVGTFITSIIKFIGYSIDSSLCPYWLSSLIIIPQIVVIGYIIAQLFRGT